jgi:hypothetical protein
MTPTASSANKAIAGLAAAAVASAAFVASALGSAPTANASCASFWGIGNGNGCTSTVGNMAIAIGTGATASAEGFFSTAMALGNSATALAFSPLSLGVAAGTSSYSNAGDPNADIADIAVTFGDHSQAFVGSMGRGTSGSIAVNLGNQGVANASGVANIAINVGGAGSTVYAESNRGTLGLNAAFALFSKATFVTLGPGPLSIAGSLFQTHQTITKTGPGININGIGVGGAAASTTAAAHISAATTAQPAAGPGSKKKAHAATAAKHANKK